jgi:hypothetical protein
MEDRSGLPRSCCIGVRWGAAGDWKVALLGMISVKCDGFVPEDLLAVKRAIEPPSAFMHPLPTLRIFAPWVVARLKAWYYFL